MVKLTKDEYEELIECRVLLNATYRMIGDYKKSFKDDGYDVPINLPLNILEIVSGYEENEKEKSE